ncbi:MAG TPA: NADH-quinone oxidoreductase subunit NuoG [Solirubrobacterales bacterium]|nr:NADH-quinone oxidoreductase subunit NuoG [Solirubrobacterales bacterium]
MSKGQEITIVIDGREVGATEGEMLHDAAKRGDVEIPIFCYEPKLGPPVGACRMCLVEIEGVPKLQTSCSTPVRDGMVVNTRSEKVKEAQNAVVEFLLVNHPLDCPVCDKGGECPLQDITMGWGPGKSRFTDPKRHFEKPLPLSPLVAIDRERCILCYRCVRFSQEVAEDSQLQLLERGDRTYVGTFDERPYVAPFHGNITDICPVGALTNYTYRFRARPWDVEEAGSVCTLCPSQCNVSFTVRDEQVKRVIARDNEEVDDGWLCDRGRYGFEMFAAEERVTEPRLRGGAAAGWDEAIAKAAAGLRHASEIDHTGAGSNSDVPGRVAAIVGDASNEEGFLVQKILREALGSPHVESRRAGGASRETLLRLAQPDLAVRTKDLDDADAILVVGTDPLHDMSILDLRIRKAIRRNGAKLVVATDRPTALDGGAVAVHRYAPGNAASVFTELGGEDVLLKAESVVVVWGERIAREGEATLDALLDLATTLGLAANDSSGLLEVPELANGRGLREAGCLPDAGPGLSETSAHLPALSHGKGALVGKTTEEIRAALESGELKSLILFGADPLRDFPDTEAWERALTSVDHLIVFSMFENATTAKADVVFPLETHAEKDGTVTHPDGRLQRVRPSAARPGSIRPNYGVLAELALALGHDTGITSQPSAFAALAEAVPFYAGLDDAEISGRGIRWQDRDPASAFPEPGEDAGTPSSLATRRSGVGGLSPEASGSSRAKRSEGVPTSSLQLGTYRDLWAGPITELNPPLKFLQPEQRIEVSPSDAERLGLDSGDAVRVSQNGTSVQAKVAVKERVQEGVCFLTEGIVDANANELLNGGPVQVEIQKVER